MDEREPEAMDDWQRLCHYVFGMMNGALSNDSEHLARGWEEYRRLGGDPEADPWPVLELEQPVPEELIARTRALREALAEYMSERGPSVQASRADKALAALLGEEAFQSERLEQRPEPEQPVAAGATCARCEALEGYLVNLGERDGRPFCMRCGTDGSGASL